MSMHENMLRAPEFLAPYQKRELLIGLACGGAMVLLFSGFTLVSRLGMRSTLAPTDLAAIRFGVGGLVLLPSFVRFGLSGLRLPEALALCCLGGLGFALLAYSGFLRAPASHGAVLLHGTLPFFTALLACAVLEERARGARLAGMTLILAGVAAMAWDSLRDASPRQLAGDAFLLAASFCWSAYTVMVRRSGLTALRASAIVAVLAFAIYIPFYLAFMESGLPEAGTADLVVQVLFQGVLIGACSILIYTRAVTALGASQTALLTAAVPCVTTLVAVPMLGERPTTLAAAGIAAVSLGMIPTLWEMKPQAQGERPCRR